MGSADFKLIRPVAIMGDVPFTRASPKWAFDRSGKLLQVPANTLAVTYDPSDLSKAPYALVEPAATNYMLASINPYSYVVAADSVAVPAAFGGTGGALITLQLAKYGDEPNKLSSGTIISAGIYTASYYADLSQSTNPTGDLTITVVAFSSSGYAAVRAIFNPVTFVRNALQSGLGTAPGLTALSAKMTGQPGGIVLVEITVRFDMLMGSPRIGFQHGAQDGDRMLIGLWQLEQGDRATSRIVTSEAPVARDADVIGAGAGLVYSSLPITEPNYDAAATYAKNAIVLDPATHMTYQSLIDANKGQALTVATAWLPLGATNRWKMFDKAVNSQTTAADVLTVVIRPGELVNTLTMLNVVGASVGVAQSDSGYNRTRSLVTHTVLSWYDFWYQEPLWLGDTVFDDIPPYPNSLLTITVSSPGNQAAIGGLFAGRAKFLGTTQWELTAGILSYSTSETDKFGNTTLVKRNNAKKMNFEVSIPRGYEDEVYRFMRAADNVEMVAIATTGWALAMSYGYLGAWEVPLSISGKTMPVEWRGLI